MAEVYLLTGSNMGDSKKHLLDAQHLLIVTVGAIIKKSSIYLTQSWGKSEQPDFLNQVLILKTDLEPFQLLARVLQIEEKMGRIRDERWGSRIIDIDILFYDDVILEGQSLVIPHPQLHNRKFTLIPLAEVAPDLLHPKLQLTAAQLLGNVDDALKVEKLPE